VKGGGDGIGTAKRGPAIDGQIRPGQQSGSFDLKTFAGLPNPLHVHS
jgi:hypothetical protein